MLRLISLSLGLFVAALAFFAATPSSFETEMAHRQPTDAEAPRLTLAANR